MPTIKILARGIPIYLPRAFLWRWYTFDAYARSVFFEGGCIAASAGFIWIASRHLHVGLAGS